MSEKRIAEALVMGSLGIFDRDDNPYCPHCDYRLVRGELKHSETCVVREAAAVTGIALEEPAEYFGPEDALRGHVEGPLEPSGMWHGLPKPIPRPVLLSDLPPLQTVRVVCSNSLHSNWQPKKS